MKVGKAARTQYLRARSLKKLQDSLKWILDTLSPTAGASRFTEAGSFRKSLCLGIGAGRLDVGVLQTIKLRPGARRISKSPICSAIRDEARVFLLIHQWASLKIRPQNHATRGRPESTVSFGLTAWGFRPYFNSMFQV